MKKIYNITGVLIVATWIMLMALLGLKQTEAFRPVQLEKQYIGTEVESRQDWSGIYLRDSKIGYNCSEIKRIEEGYQISEDIVLDLTVMDMPQKIRTRVNAVVDSDMRLQIMSFRLSAGAISMSASGTVRDKRLRLNMQTGGRAQWRDIPLSETPVLTNSLRYFVLKQGIKPGMKYTRQFFDPLTLSARSMDILVLGKESLELRGTRVDCYRVQTSFQGMTVSSWVSDRGETLREESPMGLVLVRETRQQALEEGWGARPDITAETSIKVNKSFSAAELSYLKLRLKNVDLDGFALDSGRQKLSGDELAIRRENAPEGGSISALSADPGLKPFLEPSTFIQSDDPAIVACAREHGGADPKPAPVARALNGWVYENIQKKPTLSVPSAASVLETRQGDCNEHAVLLAALCRAAGIPARVAAGLVHLNGSFYYHAWCEVFVGSWVSADPALNQFPADVSHVKFVEGDAESHIPILRLIGKLNIEVLEFL